MALPALLLASCLLATTIQAQSPRNIEGRQYIFCPCSPTERGYRSDAADELFDAMYDLQKLRAELTRDGATPSVKTARLVIASQEAWQDCVNNYSLEECVNADTALRAQNKTGGCYPNCASFCEYDPGSWRNNANGQYGPKCTTSAQWASQEPAITKGTFPVEVRRTATNPNPGAEKPAGTIIKTRPKSSPRPAAATGGSSVDQPVSGANTANGVANGPNGGDSSVPPEVDLFAPEPPPTPGAFNEGCVAVENFPVDAVLQHKNHLWRSVLCANDFCATPNHALIVEGKWTSMKQLCTDTGKWKCVRTAKLVNNLKAFANSRFTVGDITVTPYDIRYPRWCVWVIHLVQHVGIGSYTSFAVAVATLVFAAAAGAFLESAYRD